MVPKQRVKADDIINNGSARAYIQSGYLTRDNAYLRRSEQPGYLDVVAAVNLPKKTEVFVNWEAGYALVGRMPSLQFAPFAIGDKQQFFERYAYTQLPFNPQKQLWDAVIADAETFIPHNWSADYSLTQEQLDKAIHSISTHFFGTSFAAAFGVDSVRIIDTYITDGPLAETNCSYEPGEWRQVLSE